MTSPADRLSAALADRYRLERELGAGGMATVYLAEDLKHKRKVALKVLKPELAAVFGAERFVQEITTTAALQHPHSLPLFDSGEADPSGQDSLNPNSAVTDLQLLHALLTGRYGLSGLRGNPELAVGRTAKPGAGALTTPPCVPRLGRPRNDD